MSATDEGAGPKYDVVGEREGHVGDDDAVAAPVVMGGETGAARSGLILGEGEEAAGDAIAEVPGVDVYVLTSEERLAKGRAARRAMPRSAHGFWRPAPDRPDPIALLEEQARTRLPDLVPIRYGRMLASPFAFYRGGALIMAADLAATPRLRPDDAALRRRSPLQLRPVRLA